MTTKIGLYTALISFLIGTVLLTIFYFTNSTAITLYGMIFIIIAGIINFGVFIKVFIDLINEKENKRKYYFTSGIMLLNIPIVILYFYFVMILMNTMRVTLINETGKEISHLKIIGGELKTIEKLDIGERQTKWIEIIQDNDLRIEYTINGKIKSELIYGYITSFSGERIKYRIGNETKPIDETY